LSHNELIKGWPATHYDEPLGTEVYLQFKGDGKEEEDVQNILDNIRSGKGLKKCQMMPPEKLLQNERLKQAYYSMMDQGRWVSYI
jgi:hypothetical protein